MPSDSTVAILLAAGGGTRFGGGTHKLLADLGGRSLVRHALDEVIAAAIGQVVVVTGAVALDLPDGVIEAHHPDWALGQAGSLHCGLAVAAELGATAAVVGLGDQPGVTSEAWRRVATAPPAWRIVVASYDGRRGPNPVRLHRSLWAQVPATGDEGARTLMRQQPALVHEVACPGSALDIDTLEDLQRWTS